MAVSLIGAMLACGFGAAGFVLLTIATSAETNESLASRVALGLLGLTMMSGLPFLLRPFVNAWRTRRLVYLLTNQRALVVREGPALGELLVRGPLWFMLPATALLGGVTGLVGQSIAGIRILLSGELGLGATLGLLGTGLLFLFILGGLVAFGVFGLHRLFAELRAAYTKRGSFVAREFHLTDLKRNGSPKLARVRRGGVGDVLLDVDSYYESDPDSGGGSTVLLDVGFLSVPSAMAVAARIETLMAKPQPPT